MKVNISEIEVSNIDLLEDDTLEIEFTAMVGIFPKTVMLNSHNGDIIFFNTEIDFSDEELANVYLTNVGKLLNTYLISNNLKVEMKNGSYTEPLMWYDKTKKKSLVASLDISDKN